MAVIGVMELLCGERWAFRFPFELWAHIARYLKDDVSSLPKYALVCRQWQAVFERLIYRKLNVRSDDFQTGKGVISLSRFRDLMCHPTRSRRTFLRELDYTVIIPYELEDYVSIKVDPRSYCEENPTREVNNHAFRAGVVALFELLSTWGDGHKITLILEALGRQRILEPGAEAQVELGECSTIIDRERWVVRPYRARFPASNGQLLCLARYMGSRALQIAQKCSALKRLHLDQPEWTQPDLVSYMKERRQGTSIGCGPTVPSTFAQGLPNEYKLGASWSNVLPANNLLLNHNVDELSTNMRTLSLNLRELKLSEISLAMDFLFPLDDLGAPAPHTSSLYWPFLKIIKLEGVSPALPSEGELDSMTTGPEDREEIYTTTWMIGGWDASPKRLYSEHFHRLFISLGLAVRRMPMLQQIFFHLES
ncbi:hypothetical protein BJX70DRAFT_386325 [Aspergillus crustosus]